MLNAHPKVASVGELKQLVRFAQLDKTKNQLQCTCGAPSILNCGFWSDVSTLTEATIGRTIGQLNVEDYEDVKGFDRDNTALFQAIAAVSGKRYVVDSSKHIARLSLLIEKSRSRCVSHLSDSGSQRTDLLVPKPIVELWSSSSRITCAQTAQFTSL